MEILPTLPMQDALRGNLKYDKMRGQLLTLFMRDIQTKQPRKLNYTHALVLLYCFEISPNKAAYSDIRENLKNALGFVDSDINALLDGKYDQYITRMDNRDSLMKELEGLVRELVFSNTLNDDRIEQLENAILSRDGAVFAITGLLQSCVQGGEPSGWEENISRVIRLLRQIPSPVEKNMEYILAMESVEDESQRGLKNIIRSELAIFRKEKAEGINVFKRAIDAMKSAEVSGGLDQRESVTMKSGNSDARRKFKEIGREEGVQYITEMNAPDLIDLILGGDEYAPGDLAWLCNRMVNKLIAANEAGTRSVIERALSVFGNDRMVERYRTIDFLHPNEAERLFTQLMLDYAARPREENIFATGSKDAMGNKEELPHETDNKRKYANRSMVFRVLTMSTLIPEAEGQLWTCFNETQKSNPAFQNTLNSFLGVEQASVILSSSDILGEPVRWLATATNTDTDTINILSDVRLFMIKGTFDYQFSPVSYSACYYFSRVD
jgi:hypothetical protein